MSQPHPYAIPPRDVYRDYPSSLPSAAASSSRSPTPSVYISPPGQSFRSYLERWGPDEVAAWLEHYKVGQYANEFQKNNLVGKTLLDIDVGIMKEIGMNRLGDRVKLAAALKELRRRAAELGTASRMGSPNVHLSPMLSRVELEKPPLPSSSTRTQASRAGANPTRRLDMSRPPPLDLKSYSPSHALPQAYQTNYASTPPHRSNSVHPPQASQPSHSVPAPNRAPTNLRAPPRREGGRRSPSPINPPDSSQSSHDRLEHSSAAEYASMVAREQMHDSLSTPTVRAFQERSQGKPPPRGDSLSRSGSGQSGPSSPQKKQFLPANPRPMNQQNGKHPYAVKKEQDGEASRTPVRPSVSRQPTSTGTPNAISLDDLRRQLVKFVNVEDGTTRTVNVVQVASGVEILERALKKFGKWGTGKATYKGRDHESDDEHEGHLEIDGWGVYVESNPDERAKPLSENNLLNICVAHRDGTAIRDKELFLHQARPPQRRKNIHDFFGDVPPPPMSPASPNFFPGPRLGITTDKRTPMSPDEPGSAGSGPLSALKPSALSNKRLNRASMISVMSGLGVPNVEVPPSPSNTRSPSSGTPPYKKKSMYNFFGHRPPSELISSHLTDYFPGAKKRDVEKARHSLLRLSTGPKARWQDQAEMPAVVPGKGEEIISEEVVSSGNRRGPRISQPPSLPPFEPQDSLTDSLQAFSPREPSYPRPKSIRMRKNSSSSSSGLGNAARRVSVLSQLRKNRDKSDTASLLTVDEITAEVEQRRASMVSVPGIQVGEPVGESREEAEEVLEELVTPRAPADVKSDGEVSKGTESEEESSESESESESDSESEVEDEDEADHGKAFTSTGSKRNIKWIKGALIGAGSFGSVYLGMDAHNGLLMAVKQVELSTGSQKNDERKRSMLSALEREIGLLKELQHENIVQYLDSSADANHLNIFLEYVPGGSVAALLSNYGAFEEALVRNFVRQILTGLNYLHERDIVHRDIKGANILVDNKGGIKISDFGISKKAENSESVSYRIRTNRPSLQGSVFWMAPEVVKQTSYTSKADIWSVGCLVVEMLTGTHPWADLTQMQALFRIGQMSKPATPADVSSEVADFLDKTFDFDHTKRPTAPQLLECSFMKTPVDSGAAGAAETGSEGGIERAQAQMMVVGTQMQQQAKVRGMI
ncbi:hypothetical protein I350_03261 [Cryptococcus amylolentus CBS 6273]|uniref:mitogen-activated protein kinase kinase kinase n=1 Tax=Cryptococcus amylolentus CBS 6273 TaxID=1296118 RepID=A0A1E3K3K2_9TREE|nr:hypothetical protein I350_03261 [Cryptococcus amylolentus CBS 6273]